MRISKSDKTSITASIDSDIAKYKKSLEAKAAKSGVYENFGSAEIKKLQDKYSELPDDTTDYATAEHNRRAISSFEDWCMNYVGASTSTDKALQHIKAAIDILGKSGNKDSVTKDSIANLATVMFDIKASTVTAASKCKYSMKECIDAIQDQYGKNKKEAEEYYKSADAKTLEALVDGFKGNAKKTFYDD